MHAGTEPHKAQSTSNAKGLAAHSDEQRRAGAVCNLLGTPALLCMRFTTPIALPADTFLLVFKKNVLGSKLECCCTKPMTGFYRDGYCRVGPEDHGVHSVCSEMTTEFLEFSASRGNDLRGVVSAGERWCLCVSRFVTFLSSCVSLHKAFIWLPLASKTQHNLAVCYQLWPTVRDC